MIRYFAESALGLALAFGVTMTAMGAMFTFGPWADPPGMDELLLGLVLLSLSIATWRACRRSQSLNRNSR